MVFLEINKQNKKFSFFYKFIINKDGLKNPSFFVYLLNKYISIK